MDHSPKLMRFEWKYGGSHVLLAGSFSGWKAWPTMTHNNLSNIWTGEVYLPPGKHLYKFIVDGYWFYDVGKPTMVDDTGNVNNVLVVEAKLDLQINVETKHNKPNDFQIMETKYNKPKEIDFRIMETKHNKPKEMDLQIKKETKHNKPKEMDLQIKKETNHNKPISKIPDNNTTPLEILPRTEHFQNYTIPRVIDDQSLSTISNSKVGKMNNVRVFSGNANKELALHVCRLLGQNLGKNSVSTFSDGETRIQINENVRGCDIFVIQPTCPPVNDNLMELLIMLDALRRASAQRITAVVPYYGYSRQDRKHGAREPITAKLVADLITAAGPNRLLFLDLHADQIQGFFNIPVDNLLPDTLFVEYMKEKQLNETNAVIVSPDVGGTRRARRIAKHLNLKIALLEYRNMSDTDEKIINVVGDLSESAVIVDDMIDTGSRLIAAANILKERGVQKVYACASHAVFSGDMAAIENSLVDEVIVTDSIPLPPCKRTKQLHVVSIAPIFAEAIRRIHNEEALDPLFSSDIYI